MKIWYNKTAFEWTQALPIGNGHMGAMCYGGEKGLFDLTENTCWSGENQICPIKKDAGKYMEAARKFLADGNPKEAHKILSEHCIGIKGNYGTQLPMARFNLTVEAKANSTYRELNLVTGVTKDLLTYNKQKIIRKSFISNPKKVLAVTLQTDKGCLPVISMWLEGAAQPCSTKWRENSLTVNGRALENIHSDGLTGVQYVVKAQYITDGTVQWNRRGLVFADATYLNVYITASTSMYDHEMEKTCDKNLTAAINSGFRTIFNEHRKEHSKLMNRCSFYMPSEYDELPTDERISKFSKHRDDLGLISLFFQFGRYVLINSSREDSLLPAALQGVWNDNRACRMEWTDDMHLDINTQMNYFPAEKTGIGECTVPLLKWIKNKLMPNGKVIAKELFQSEGWIANSISNAYGWAAPGWSAYWGIAPTCGGWIATHIWEHYLYTQDLRFLAEYFDVLYECAKGLCGLLTLNKQTGELVTNPSYSPENQYFFEGGKYALTTGSTFDISVLKYIFNSVCKSAEILGKEDDFTTSLKEAAKKLPDYKIGKYGQLMEWNQDFEEPFPDHRHTSHLLAMFPFNIIEPDKNETLKEAIKTTLNRRIGKEAIDILNANWAGALLITYYARLLEGEKAGEFVKHMISYLSRENMMITHQGPTTSITGGIYELDGNTGFTSAVAEMLLQGYSDKIRLLPAVPAEWSEGQFSGMRVYGGHIVDAKWKDNKVNVQIIAAKSDHLKLSYKNEMKEVIVEKGMKYTVTL